MLRWDDCTICIIYSESSTTLWSKSTCLHSRILLLLFQFRLYESNEISIHVPIFVDLLKLVEDNEMRKKASKNRKRASIERALGEYEHNRKYQDILESCNNTFQLPPFKSYYRTVLCSRKTYSIPNSTVQ